VKSEHKLKPQYKLKWQHNTQSAIFYIGNKQTSETPTARSNISIAPSDKASDAHDIAAASATTQDMTSGNTNYLVGMPSFKCLNDV